MSKVITFSRFFPSYHPEAGNHTYFVEQILNWYFGTMKNLEHNPALHFTSDIIKQLNPELYQVGMDTSFIESLSTEIDSWKNHTIRAGHRFKAGDWFKPVVWMLPGGRFIKGNKQIQFAPDIQIKKVWDFDIAGEDGKFFVDQSPFTSIGAFVDDLAKNDGLTAQDFKDWLKHPEPFSGQIICWNESIEY